MDQHGGVDLVTTSLLEMFKSVCEMSRVLRSVEKFFQSGAGVGDVAVVVSGVASVFTKSSFSRRSMQLDN